MRDFDGLFEAQIGVSVLSKIPMTIRRDADADHHQGTENQDCFADSAHDDLQLLTNKIRQPGDLGVLRGAQTSRRKRGPVALRHQLWLILPLSQVESRICEICRQFWNLLKTRVSLKDCCTVRRPG